LLDVAETTLPTAQGSITTTADATGVFDTVVLTGAPALVCAPLLGGDSGGEMDRARSIATFAPTETIFEVPFVSMV
jgi:hypothetical protein